MHGIQNEEFQPQGESQQSPTHSEEVTPQREASGQLPVDSSDKSSLLPADENSSGVIEPDRQSNASTHSDTASAVEGGNNHPDGDDAIGASDQSHLIPATNSRLAQVFSYLCCCKGRREIHETSYPAI